MTISELREIISDLPGDMDVLIPAHPFEGFTGVLFPPCIEESQPVTTSVEEGVEEEAFMLVPCGFFDKEHDETVALN